MKTHTSVSLYLGLEAPVREHVHWKRNLRISTVAYFKIDLKKKKEMVTKP